MSSSSQPIDTWHRLDNTANLFPVIASRKFSNVYRLWLNLSEPVNPEILQQAVDKVLPWFPAFAVRMRRGLFWRYLESNSEPCLVKEEDDYPCRYIDPTTNNHYLFSISYFENRINLEVFHVLSDGTGSLKFLQAICCQYLLLAHPDTFDKTVHTTRWFAENSTDTEDSYLANYKPTKKSTFRVGKAYRITGERTPFGALHVMNIYLPLSQLLDVCHAYHVSVTQYITACVGWAVYTKQCHGREPKYPVNVFLPVNLRNIFPSTTTLNFFSNVFISLKFGPKGYTFEDLLAEVKQQFTEKITPENMLERISYTVGSGYSPLVRAVPLPLKNIFLRAIFESSSGSSTMGYSNVGKVIMPEPFSPFVTGSGVLLSCSSKEPIKCSSTSYGNLFTLTFSSLLSNYELQRAAIAQMVADGIDVTIESNEVHDEKM